METVLYPRGIISIAVRFLQLICRSSSALDDYMVLLHGNIDLWSLVSEREETQNPSDFNIAGNTISKSTHAANPPRQ